ncbi:MAG: sulfite exporter TauE/SafE family protein [Peptococcaceae bacterium]|nr:sulfite exporter TauE/SafE family protein [Peptococcaceae bacterium]
METSGILFFLILFLACIVSGLAGFGSNILALPFLSLFLDVKTIVPVLVLTVFCNGLPRLLTQYRHINLRVYGIMLPLAVIGGIIGIRLTAILPEGIMKLLLAILMLLVSVKGIYELRSGWKLTARKKLHPFLHGIPVIGGIMQGAFACGGPLFNIYILLNLQKKEQIRATQFAIGATSSCFIFLQYLAAGAYQGQTLHFALLLFPAVLLAYVVSEYIFKQIDSSQFLHIVYLVLFFAGLMTGWQAFCLL